MTVGTDPEWGASPWRVAVAVPAAPLPARRSVVVVGGGLTGLAAAWGLARSGIDVAVLEAAAVGDGASGRTGGIVLEETAAGPRVGVSRCVPFLARVVAENGIACDLRLDGCDELEHRALDDAPAGAWRDGATALVAARRVAGGSVDPGALVAGLARAARAAGATIHERTPVTAIAGGRPLTVHAGDRAVAAEHVVLALNAYTGTLVAPPPTLRAALTFALCTAPLDVATLAALGLDGGIPFYTADLPYLWGRPLADGRVVFGAGLAFDEGGDVRRIALAGGAVAAALAALEARVRGLHPRLGAVEVVARWGGPIAFRRGAEPVLGAHPALPGVVVTGAYAGHGVALAVRAGALVAAAIAAGRPLPAWGAFD